MGYGGDTNEKSLETWEELEVEVKKLKDEFEKKSEGKTSTCREFLFRGHGDFSWELETTLDRTGGRHWSFADYFHVISKAKPQIETFTGQRWELEEFPQLREWSNDWDNINRPGFPGYDYLVFLRHHGFPSPLLDWTRSFYVAVFFAFINPQNERVALYIYKEHNGIKLTSSDGPLIKSFGQYVRSHPRHFLQQSQYTIAAELRDGQLVYASHEEVFKANKGMDQDFLWKFTIPQTERIKVLKILEEYNLNKFSLFQTNEALLSTIAVRELEL